MMFWSRSARTPLSAVLRAASMILHAVPPTSVEEDTRNLTFWLSGKANISIREHVLTFSSGAQSIRATVPMIAPKASSGRMAAGVRVGLCEQIPTRVGEVAGQDLSASVRNAAASNLCFGQSVELIDAPRLGAWRVDRSAISTAFPNAAVRGTRLLDRRIMPAFLKSFSPG